MLKDRGITIINHFDKMDEDEFLRHFDFENKITYNKPISNEEIRMLLNLYNPEKNGIRDRLILLLFIYIGIDIKDIKNLRIEDIKNKSIKINERKIPLPDKLNDDLLEFIKTNKKNKVKFDYIFSTKYNGCFRQMSDSTFNRVISQHFNATDIDIDRKKVLNSSFIKSSLIQKMFWAGFSIEQIKYITGLTLGAISEYISDDHIAKKVQSTSLKMLTTKHPYIEFFK